MSERVTDDPYLKELFNQDNAAEAEAEAIDEQVDDVVDEAVKANTPRKRIRDASGYLEDRLPHR